MKVVAIKTLDNMLNNITMYRLVVYGLGGISLVAIMMSVFGRLPYEPSHIIASLIGILGASYVTDLVLSKVWQTPRNIESWLITGLILFLIMPPATSVVNGIVLCTAGVIASASKYIIAYRGKHIFNPAAFAAAVLSLTGALPASWWVGTSALWPFMLIVGLAVVYKIRRFPMVLTFVVTAITLQLIVTLSRQQPLMHAIQSLLIASPLIFLATIMLTEPATMPPRKNQQILFAAAVAVLYSGILKFGHFYIYPELALLIGNALAFVISPKFRARLQLKEIHKISDRVYDYVFTPEKPFRFVPGQYMEWTLPNVPFDSRGNRRTFTIASSPTERDIHMGVKYYDPTSAFKYTLSRLRPGEWIYASQLAGNFTLERGEGKKLVFIAGGIGITPFRSMIKYITDTNQQTDAVLLYVVNNPREFAYVSEFREAAAHGVRFIPIVTQAGFTSDRTVNAPLSPELIARLVPDYAQRTYYVSGPNVMVDATKSYLARLGVSAKHIKTDHFSGY